MRLPSQEPVLNVYVDESSQNQHRFLVLGGIACSIWLGDYLCNLSRIIRRDRLPSSELKWTKVSASKLQVYKEIVDQFFVGESYDGSPVHFHCLVVETARRNEWAYNGGSRETGFNKEIYQLLMKFGRLYKGCVFHVYPDHRETTAPLEELRLILNRGMLKKGDGRDWPFRRVHFRKSHDEPMLQMTDLLTGAVAFHLNGHRLAANASPAKCELSDYVLHRAGISDVTRDTATSGKFTIWHRRLRGVSRS